MTPLLRPGDGGATTVELVLVLPVFMSLVLLAVQAGMVVFAAETAQDAAHNGVEATRGERDPTAAGTAAAHRSLAAAGAVADTHVAVRRDGDRVVVDVTGVAPRVVPGVAVRIAATATGVTERFRPQPERP